MIDIEYSSGAEFISAVKSSIPSQIIRVFTAQTTSHLGDRLRRHGLDISVFRDPVEPCVYIRERQASAYKRARRHDRA